MARGRAGQARTPTVPAPPLPAAAARRVLERLASEYPGATTELRYSSPFELLVATILSAQCTDARVNQVTPALFARYPDAQALARAELPELERLIQPTGFFRAKARTLVAVARALVERHGGEVPARLDDLVQLPGVGRKTANVVLGHALGVPGLAVDRHVLRVANRIGLAASDDPDVVEAQLCRLLPPEAWTRASDTLILHGRRVCRPTPRCQQCVVRTDCLYAQRRPRAAPSGGRARTATPLTRRTPASRGPVSRRGPSRR